MKKILGIILSVAIVLGCVLTSFTVSHAAVPSDIQIKGEYLIRDNDGLHTRYVILAVNTSGCDISARGVFSAVSADGSKIKTVTDMAEAIRKDQTFILYGQFRNEDAAGGNFTYDIQTAPIGGSGYDNVKLDVTASAENSLIITGTNYSGSDMEAINVRGLFFKDGSPVAFDWVNMADTGYILHSGSTNVQELGLIPADYDDYIVTYTVVGGDI